MASVSCNYTVHLSEQAGLILGQVKGSETAKDELVGRPSFKHLILLALLYIYIVVFSLKLFPCFRKGVLIMTQ